MTIKHHSGWEEERFMNKKYKDYSTFLFATPSFTQGFASAIDLGGTLVVYNSSRSDEEADRRALASDWDAVGADLWTAIVDELQRRTED